MAWPWRSLFFLSSAKAQASPSASLLRGLAGLVLVRPCPPLHPSSRSPRSWCLMAFRFLPPSGSSQPPSSSKSVAAAVGSPGGPGGDSPTVRAVSCVPQAEPGACRSKLSQARAWACLPFLAVLSLWEGAVVSPVFQLPPSNPLPSRIR